MISTDRVFYHEGCTFGRAETNQQHYRARTMY